jgi:hypothetical protein
MATEKRGADRSLALEEIVSDRDDVVAFLEVRARTLRSSSIVRMPVREALTSIQIQREDWKCKVFMKSGGSPKRA